MHVCLARFGWAALAMICLSFMSCTGGPSPPVQFYMFNPVTSAGAGPNDAAEQTRVRASVEPVGIPRYLNRPQIVTHMDGTAYHLNEFNQWLEPLGDTLTRVVAEDLAEMLGADGIDIITSSRFMKADFRITVEVLRLDGQPGRQAVLTARWSLFDQAGNNLVLTRQSEIQEALADDSFLAFVTAQNRMVTTLCREMADAVRPIMTTHGVGFK